MTRTKDIAELAELAERTAKQVDRIEFTVRQLTDGGTWLTALHADVQAARVALHAFTDEVRALRAEVMALRDAKGQCPLAERLGVTP